MFNNKSGTNYSLVIEGGLSTCASLTFVVINLTLSEVFVDYVDPLMTNMCKQMESFMSPTESENL